MKGSAMLSTAHTEVVKATLPLVGGAIGEITPVFYRRLFAAHPELERDLFNRGNQANGSQQKALAGSVAMYATLLVDPDAPGAEVVERIAHKHASLGVAPEQYPVVYEHLFAAIVEVLGADVVTADVAEAWTAVYWSLADTLIGRERELYEAAGTDPAHVWMPVRVVERVQQSPLTVAFGLTAVDGAELPDFAPGQYISVAVQLPDGARQIRQYSLSHVGDGDRWRISVRREGSVSSHLHEYVFEGDVLQVSHPFGDITLDSPAETPLLLISAGIGITPVLGMLYFMAAEQPGRPLTVVHCDRTRASHAHRAELADLVEQIPGATLHTWYDGLPDGYPLTEPDRHGRIDLSAIDFPADANVYICGPAPFMEEVVRQLGEAGVPRDRIWFEAFSPLEV
ncbi:hemin transporter [Mycobacterium sp. CBMA293]|nr:hemin transporter [Mycolicibacterium sp. CBMA 360]MUL62186.1 hemin transporter [Mycolicibacterium sp. CBMA 335]MUL71647.1 hemin transporter [Mycolicibacterium sp. CBMA 311]MUL93602.1 hemin transporter [Mycolicibacterium sp. CBMA 230]MUM10488.1 hemin transporter [Mycolicibacterium sp. CBMA 293]